MRSLVWSFCGVVLLVLCAAGGARATDWHSCGGGLLSVKEVQLAPEPIQPGVTAKFTLDAEAGAQVSGGSIEMLVKYAGLPIWTQTDDLCAKTACPLVPGPVKVEFSQLFPEITPPGRYTVQLTGKAGQTQLFCVAVDFQVEPPSAGLGGEEGAARRGGEYSRRLLA